MASITELYRYLLALDEGKAEFAQDIIKIINNLTISEDEKLTKIYQMSKKAIEKYEKLSAA